MNETIDEKARQESEEQLSEADASLQSAAIAASAADLVGGVIAAILALFAAARGLISRERLARATADGHEQRIAALETGHALVMKVLEEPHSHPSDVRVDELAGKLAGAERLISQLQHQVIRSMDDPDRKAFGLGQLESRPPAGDRWPEVMISEAAEQRDLIAKLRADLALSKVNMVALVTERDELKERNERQAQTIEQLRTHDAALMDAVSCVLHDRDCLREALKSAANVLSVPNYTSDDRRAAHRDAEEALARTDGLKPKLKLTTQEPCRRDHVHD